jgi:hypothetical protein
MEMVGTGSLAEDVFKDTIWMDKQSTGPEKGHLGAINDAVRTGTNVVCVSDFVVNKLGHKLLRLASSKGARIWEVVRACARSRAVDRNRTAESPMTLRGDLHECPYRPL